MMKEEKVSLKRESPKTPKEPVFVLEDLLDDAQKLKEAIRYRFSKETFVNTLFLEKYLDLFFKEFERVKDDGEVKKKLKGLLSENMGREERSLLLLGLVKDVTS